MHQSSRNRKIGYMVAIALLYTSVVFTSGKIEQQAVTHKIAQRSVGNIDPVSGAAQFVLVGMRGIAVTILWDQAIQLKTQQRWFEIEPVLDAITILQPNFVNPWTYQAWNMAYNIAAVWESVEDKYYWMTKGIRYMRRSTEYNRDLPDMIWYVGWLYHNRFGMSDEKTFLREIFKNDPDDSLVLSKEKQIRDNFYCAYDWFKQANSAVLSTEPPKLPKTKGVTPFMSYTALSVSEYAKFLAEDGVFGDRLRNAWREAFDKWREYGGYGDYKKDRDDPIHRLEFSPEEFAEILRKDKAEGTSHAYWIEHYRKIVNFNFHRNRAFVESGGKFVIDKDGRQSAELYPPDRGFSTARMHLFNAKKARSETDYEKALVEYEKAFPLWREVLEDHDFLRNDYIYTEDAQTWEGQYLTLKARFSAKDEDIPERPFKGLFPVAELLDAPYKETPATPPTTETKPDGKPAEAKPAESKPADSKPAEAKPAESKPAESKPADSKPAESKPAESKPAEAKPAESKPTESKPAEAK